jgi:hypothetical protein
MYNAEIKNTEKYLNLIKVYVTSLYDRLLFAKIAIKRYLPLIYHSINTVHIVAFNSITRASHFRSG